MRNALSVVVSFVIGGVLGFFLAVWGFMGMLGVALIGFTLWTMFPSH